MWRRLGAGIRPGQASQYSPPKACHATHSLAKGQTSSAVHVWIRCVQYDGVQRAARLGTGVNPQNACFARGWGGRMGGGPQGGWSGLQRVEDEGSGTI